MSLRHLILKDFWLKLFSLAVAVLIWLTVSVAIRKERSAAMSSLDALDSRTFPLLPVLVVSALGDVHNFKVNPDQVEVTVRGEERTLASLQDKDIRVIVDLTDIGTAHVVRKRVDVSGPPGVALVRVVPEDVEVVVPPRP
jgi:YbbR domain-containing protein